MLDGKLMASGSPNAGPFFGHLDGVGETIFGWCLRRGASSLPRLAVEIGGRTVAYVFPVVIRSDINELFGTECASGFSFALSTIHPSVLGQLAASRHASLQASIYFLSDRYYLPSNVDTTLPRYLLTRMRAKPRELSSNFRFSWEVVGDRLIHGWVFHTSAHFLEVSIDIYYQTIHVDTIVANEPRPDLAARLGCQLLCGFSYDLGRLHFLNEAGPLEVDKLEARISGAEDDTAATFSALVRSVGVRSATDIRDVQVSASFFTKPADLSKRLAIYAIHNRRKSLTANQIGAIRMLKDQGYSVVVSNSFPGNAECLAPKVEELADVFVVRGNYGRDFASWVGFVLREYDLIRSRDHTLFINDSIVGPCQDTEWIFRRLSSSVVPIIGLTDSYEQQYHLQTSFFVLRDTAWES